MIASVKRAFHPHLVYMLKVPLNTKDCERTSSAKRASFYCHFHEIWLVLHCSIKELAIPS